MVYIFGISLGLQHGIMNEGFRIVIHSLAKMRKISLADFILKLIISGSTFTHLCNIFK